MSGILIYNTKTVVAKTQYASRKLANRNILLISLFNYKILNHTYVNNHVSMLKINAIHLILVCVN